VTPQLISVQDFAFRRWSLSLLVASAFPPGSLRLALQSTARRKETDETYVHHNKKKNEPLIKHFD
jgi:hypothetical protein